MSEATERELGASRGAALRASVQGARNEELHAALGALDPQLSRWADEFIFGEVWDGDELAVADRQLVAIVALASTGKPDQLRNYLHGALQGGYDPRRIHAALRMLIVYVGWPTTLEAMTVWREVVNSARRRGAVVDVPVSVVPR